MNGRRGGEGRGVWSLIEEKRVLVKGGEEGRGGGPFTAYRVSILLIGI